MSEITIAIDGYSSTGKSTLAKRLANALGYTYVDTGAMYRAVTLYAMRKQLIVNDKVDVAGLLQALQNMELKFVFNPRLGYSEMYLDGENVETKIRTMPVSNHVSQVAAIPEVRKKLVALQKEMGKKKGVVMDGRDIGTVVFPDAELKIFMTASPETRAKRRYCELVGHGEEVTFEEVQQNIEERDSIDSGRSTSPLKKADDAVIIDNSNLNEEEQFTQALELARQAIANKKGA